MLERINLVPQQFLAQRIKRSTPVIIGVLLCLAAGVFLLFASSLAQRINALDKEIQTLRIKDDALKNMQAMVTQLSGHIKQLGEEEKQLQEVVANLARIPEQKQSFSALLDAVVLILPPTVRCEKITLGAKNGQISGQATIYRDLPAFVQKLGEIPRLRNVSLSVLNQEQKKEGDILAFNIVFELQGGKQQAANP
jgi:Tfp pilus assembly protein PilN